MFSFVKDKDFLKKAILIALPITLQNLLSTSTNFIDTLMVATLDATSVASVGLGNKVYYILNSIFFGIISGGMILGSQYVGAKKMDGYRRTYGLVVIITVAIAIFTMFCCFFNTRFIMSILTNRPECIKEGVKYLRLVCLSYPLIAISMSTNITLRSIGEVRIPVITALFALVTNTIFNYMFINGNLGAPRLGIEGAALATILSRAIEASLTIVFLFVSKNILLENKKDLISFDKKFLKLFIRYDFTTALDEIMWGVGTALYFVAYGRTSTAEISAISILGVLNDLVYTIFIGVCSACSVFLGIELGRGKTNVAKEYATHFLQIMLLLSFILSLIIYLSRGFVLIIYGNLGAEVLLYLEKLIIIFAVVLFVANINFLIMCGILRSGGDNFSCVIIDLITCWFIGVPLAFLSAVVWKLPIHIIFLLIKIEEAMKSILAFIRYKKGYWIKNIVN